MRACNKCGVKRTVQVTAKIHEGDTTFSLKRVCFYCLLKMTNVMNVDGTLNRDLIMGTHVPRDGEIALQAD